MSSAQRAALLHRVFWRLHFWAGLLTSPIVLFAAVTGILYAFTPQIEAWKHAPLDQASMVGRAQPLDLQVAAAELEHADKTLRFIVPAYQLGETTQVYFNPAPGTAKDPRNFPNATVAYVNPVSTEVQGSLVEMDRFRNWSRKLHSSALQGEGWRWAMELAASWLVIMLITGVYMWWPRGRATWRSVFLPSGRDTRATWRYLHSLVAVVMSGLFSVVLVTGLTWSKYAGANFSKAQESLGQNSPRAPKDLQSRLPVAGATVLSAQAVYDKAVAEGPAVKMQMTPPTALKDGALGVWRVENFDRSQPEKRFAMLLDAYSGAVLYNSGWDKLPVVAKATAVGIPFHRGEFGWWNQALLVMVGLTAMFSVASGYVMWFKRRAKRTLGAPAIATVHVRAVPVWVWAVLAVLGYALPVFGISLMVLLALEAGAVLWRHQNKPLAVAGG